MSLAHAFVSALRNCLIQVVRNADSFALRLLQRAEYALEQSLTSNSSNFPGSSSIDRRVALSNLQQHRAQLISHFPQHLLQSLISSAHQPFSSDSQPFDTGLLQLAPTAEAACQQLLLETKLVNQLAPQVELALADLDALMSGAQGLEWVQPESNPLRVESYVRALSQSLSAVQPAAQVLDCWQHFMGLQLGSLLSSEYVRTTQLLRQQEVSPAQYAQGGAGSERPAPSLLTLRLLQALATDLRWIDDPQLEAPQLQTQFLVDGWPETEMRSPVLAPVTMLETRVQTQLLPAQSDVQGPAKPSSQSVRRLRTLQRMMSHMTADTRLLPRVQAVLRQLEPALGQVAQSESAFFDDSTHPARQLLDELTARSLWFSSESVAGYAHFIGVAEQAARALVTQPSVNAAGFAGALRQMREQWPPEGRLSTMSAISGQPGSADGVQSTQGMMSSALGLVERHAAMVAQQTSPDEDSLDQIIRKLPSARQAPEDIVDFVCGPWAEVIFKAQQKDSAGAERDPGGYLALVPSLLWSVSPEATQDAGRLVAIAPKLQRRLARGLRSVGRSEVEIAALAARISGLHQYRLDAAQVAIQPRPDLFAPTVLLDDPADAAGNEACDNSAQPAMAVSTTVFANFADHSGSGENLNRPSEPSAIGSAAVGTAAVETAAVAIAAVAAEGEWAVGVWVELHSELKQLRTQLTWVSPQQSLFMFTADDGSTQSMTRRMRDKLLAQGQLRRLQTAV